MKVDELVIVYPHGSPELAAEATVVMISANERSIAVAFGDPPGFQTAGRGIAIHPDFGVMLFAHRVELNGRPWGPWVELFHGGHFEIEDWAIPSKDAL